MKAKQKSLSFEITRPDRLAGVVAGNGQVVKRDKKIVPFDSERVADAVRAANAECGSPLSDKIIGEIAEDVMNRCLNLHRPAGVEEIQLMVVSDLGKVSSPVAESYQRYRETKALIREAEDLNKSVKSQNEGTNSENNSENANKDGRKINAANSYNGDKANKVFQKSRIAFGTDEKTAVLAAIDAAHDAGVIHRGDAAQYGMRMHNCGLADMHSILNEKGTVINGIKIDPPKTLRTAAIITAQVIAQTRSCQYGGLTISLEAFAPLVEKTRKRLVGEAAQELAEAGLDSAEAARKIGEKRLRKEVADSMQTLYYQINTLMDVGGQIPFVTIHMDLTEASDGQEKADLALLIEEMLEQRAAGVLNEKGMRTVTTFPKLVFVVCEDNAYEGSPYHWLLKKAVACSTAAMTPDFISEKISREMKEGQVMPVMGCRSALPPYTDEDGNEKRYGRFNQGVCTLNLADAALSSGGDEEVFWTLLKERLEIVHNDLRIRHETLEGTPASVAPILWQHGVYGRLEADEPIDRLLHGGYSSISVGYAGLAEAVYYMTGQSHTEDEGRAFGMRVMQALNDACEEWKAAEDLGYSVYGTPIESTTGDFAQGILDRFGLVDGVTGKGYVTNSYHIPVTEEIDAFEKLEKEAPFQRLSPGGSITYVEVPNNLADNQEAALALVQFMYEHNYYAEINIKIDLCTECGYRGEHEMRFDEDGNAYFVCPNCGNSDPDKQEIIRRICGYIGVVKRGINKARLAEFGARKEHTGIAVSDILSFQKGGIA